MFKLFTLALVAILSTFQCGSALSTLIPDAVFNAIQTELENTLYDVLIAFDGETATINVGEIKQLNLTTIIDVKEGMNMDIEIPSIGEQRVNVLIEEQNNRQTCDMAITTAGDVRGLVAFDMGGSASAVVNASIPNGAEIDLNVPIRPDGTGVKGNIVVDFQTNPQSDFYLGGGSKSMIADIEVVSTVDLEVFSLAAGTEIFAGHSWSLVILFFVFVSSLLITMVYIWIVFVMKSFSNQLSATQQPSFSKDNTDISTIVCTCGVVNNWGANFCRSCGQNIVYNNEGSMGRASVGPGATNPLYKKTGNSLKSKNSFMMN